MNIEENVSLKELTTFNIGGKAKFFVRIKQINDLQIVIAFAASRKVPVFVLGGGSNIVMSDEGFPGLVVKIEIEDVIFNESKTDAVIVSAGAGVVWDDLVALCVGQNLYGLENLSFIPGTVGATPVQNIGAYGAEVKNVIEWVEALDLETGVMRHFSRKECDFQYRSSIFKTPEGKKYIITRVGFCLKKHGALITSYKDIAEHMKTLKKPEMTLQEMRDLVIDIRTKKLPSVKEYGTAGSFFKNPIITKKQYETLLKKYPELPGFPSEPTFASDASAGTIKIPAGWVLDNLCGFKGAREGDVGVYKNQALVLVNFGKGTAKEIKKLAEKMCDSFKEKTGIILEREVEYV